MPLPTENAAGVVIWRISDGKLTTSAAGSATRGNKAGGQIIKMKN
jgi:hypothetical protein